MKELSKCCGAKIMLASVMEGNPRVCMKCRRTCVPQDTAEKVCKCAKFTKDIITTDFCDTHRGDTAESGKDIDVPSKKDIAEKETKHNPNCFTNHPDEPCSSPSQDNEDWEKKRRWIFVACNKEVPFFSEIFDDFDEMKNFSGRHSVHWKKAKGIEYTSTYFDLVGTQFIRNFLSQATEEAVERERQIINKEWVSLKLQNSNKEDWDKELTKFALFMQDIINNVHPKE